MYKITIDFGNKTGSHEITSLTFGPSGGVSIPGVQWKAQQGSLSFVRDTDRYSFDLNGYFRDAAEFKEALILLTQVGQGNGNDAAVWTICCEDAMISSFAMNQQKDYVGMSCGRITVTRNAAATQIGNTAKDNAIWAGNQELDSRP